MFAHGMFTPQQDVMTICLTLSYFFARNNHSMAQNNDPMSSAQAESTQGNPPRPMSIESYFLQTQNFLSSTAHQMTEFRQSQSALEARVISLQNEINRPDERQGEPSFVIKPFTRKKRKEPKKQSTRGWADGSLILSSIPRQIVRRLLMSSEN